MQKLRFISGTPRSGSTLLANLLCQNSDFNATQTSGCLDVLFNVRNHWEALSEHKAHPLPKSKVNVLRAMLYAYYQDCDKNIVFDKSRGWPGHIELLENLIQEKAKILVCVRSIPDILSSMEKLNRETAKVKQPPGEANNYALFQTQAGRCEFWMKPEGLVGIAYNRVLDAVKRGYEDRLHFVDYDNLTRFPDLTMKDIYQFLEEPFYQHNFDHVEQITTEDDEIHGYVNLHKIHPKVTARPSDAVSVLGLELVKKYKPMDFII